MTAQTKNMLMFYFAIFLIIALFAAWGISLGTQKREKYAQQDKADKAAVAACEERGGRVSFVGMPENLSLVRDENGEVACKES